MYLAYKNNRGTKERGTKIIPIHALDKIRNPIEVCLPPSRASLTAYALEYGGALRMIRVSVFSNDLMTGVMSRGVAETDIYRPKLPTSALGSNRLKVRRRCNLGGSGEPT